eukprot:SAG31_NODE_831_length_11669_cov_3.410026_15_plen_863_part_00
MSNNMAVMVQQNVDQATETGAGGGVRQILARMRNADHAEREVLKQQLLGKAAEQGETKAAATTTANQAAKSPRQLIDAALRAAAEIEKIGMGADLLGRLSNRARRAGKIDDTTLDPMSTLDLSGAPVVECNVMMMDGPAAILVRRVSDELAESNTCDFAIDFALAVGGEVRNQVFCPDIIGLEDGVADQIEATQKSLSNEETAVAIPIVTLADPRNRQQVCERLCIALMGGIKLQSVWLVALAAIEHTLATKQWAGPGTPAGDMLTYLGGEIMQHVHLPKGHALAMEKAQPLRVALAQNLPRAEFTMHYPVSGTVTAASAVIRWGSPTASPFSFYAACITARASRAVAQQRLHWLKRCTISSQGPGSNYALWSAIYDVRATEDGIIAPISGTHKVPTTWSGLLAPYDEEAIDRFATTWVDQVGAGGGDALLKPGLTLVVRGALNIIDQHISASRAVEIMRQFHHIAAAEAEPETSGIAEDDDAISALASWLAWARQPMVPLTPFATPNGPSTLFFYHNRTQGAGVTNMASGFQWNIDEPGWTESESQRFERLANHIRVVRADLLHREYGYDVHGQFTKKTRSFPLLARMTDVWLAGTAPTDDEFIGEVINQLLEGHTGNLHDAHLEHDIAMLIPSQLKAGMPTRTPGVDRISVAHRLREELAGRTTDELSVHDAPPAIWVPQSAAEAQVLERTSSYEQMQERLAKGRAAIAAARATAAKKAAAVDTQQQTAAAPVDPSARDPDSKTTFRKVTRNLLKLLRHDAKAVGLTIRPDGYVSLSQILALEEFEGVKPATIDTIVEQDEKGRYHVMTEDGTVWIRANQGHSIASVDESQLLTEITDASELPVCLHGTCELTAFNPHDY